MDRLQRFFKYRPLSVLAMMGALRDLLLGIGFLIGLDQITRTLIYQNYNELIPGWSGPVVGLILIILSIIIIWSGINTKRQILSVTLKAQSALWLFSTIMYALNGHWILAAIFGVFFCLPAVFIALYAKYRPPQDHILRKIAKDKNER